MKIRENINLKVLEDYGYCYEENLVYPIYQKKTTYGNKIVTIDIFINDRTITINESKTINKSKTIFIYDLITCNMIEK